MSHALDGEENAPPADAGPAGPVVLLPIVGIPEVSPGADLGTLILEAATASGIELADDDVLVVTHKIVSKAEGRIREVPPDDIDARHAIAEMEAARIVRRRSGLIIAETRHGFVCANAGVDASNLEPGQVMLLHSDGVAEAHVPLGRGDEAREHPEQRGLARAVGADDADLRARIERQVDALEDVLAAADLPEVLHREDEVLSHGQPARIAPLPLDRKRGDEADAMHRKGLLRAWRG